MEKEPSYNDLNELTSRICAIIQGGPACLPFFQHCLFFCLLLVGRPQTVMALQHRDIVTWSSIILRVLCLEESNISRKRRKWSAHCLGRLLNLSEAGIPATLLDEPWDHSAEDITPTELRSIYSILFSVELGEPRVVGESELQCLSTSLNQSVLFKDTPIQHISEWYGTIMAQIPIFPPVWFEVIPPNIIPRLGIRALSVMRTFISDAEAKCPSLRDHKKSFLLILVFHALYSGENDALDGWTISRDGQNLYHSLMNTFASTNEAAEYLLILAVFLCVAPYWEMSSTHGPHQPSNDPLPDLGNFVEGQSPVDRRMILEETAFAAIRVLTDENFNHRFEKPRQTERKYLSTVLIHTVGKRQPMLEYFRYCKARIDGPVDHAEAFRISTALTTAKHIPHAKLLYEDRSESGTTSTTSSGKAPTTTSSTTTSSKTRFSCSRTTSSATLRDSICDEASGKCKAQKRHVEFPDHIFTIQFVGRRGVGKSGIINRAVNGCYVNEYNPTVGHERHSKMLPVRNKFCRLDIVDTEGQDLLSTSEQMHVKGKDVLVLVYDTTSRQSFQDISGIFNAHKQDVIIMLVGNKSDLREQRQVQLQEGMELAHNLGAHFWEVSALKGDSINEMFQRMALLLDRQYSDSDGAVEKSIWSSETVLKDLWKAFAFVFQSCMGAA